MKPMNVRSILNDYDTVRRAVKGQVNPEGTPYRWFTKPWDMNVVIVRMNTPGKTGQSRQTDRFDDYAVWAYVDNDGRKICEVFAVTAESGLKYLRRKLGSIVVKGRRYARTAILLPQQVLGMWDWRTARGHKGYPAGRQVKPALYAADIDADGYLDLNYTVNRDGSVKIINRALTFRGNILSNFHRASRVKVLASIFGYSAACVVTQSPKDWARQLWLVSQQIKAGYGSRTTMTLLTRQAVEVAAR